jgi:putative heme iron utilization protein
VTFGPDVVAAVCRHMNDDHPADSLLICRTLGGHPDATAARMTGLDAQGADFEVTIEGGVEQVRLPWSRTLTERPQIRQEVVRMYEQACAAAGVAPRPH